MTLADFYKLGMEHGKPTGEIFSAFDPERRAYCYPARDVDAFATEEADFIANAMLDRWCYPSNRYLSSLDLAVQEYAGEGQPMNEDPDMPRPWEYSGCERRADAAIRAYRMGYKRGCAENAR